MVNKKTKIAIVSLTSCEGCEVAILDLGQKLIEALGGVELIRFKYMMESERETLKNCDVAFVEGSPTNKRDIGLLKEVRENSKLVIALGTCAHLGGVQKIKDYGDKEKFAQYVYGEHAKDIENNAGGGIDLYVKVDAVVPGCPINKEEFFRYVLNLLAGTEFKIEENPVCYECISHGYECLLQKGEICLGPLSYAGCNAVCLKSKQGCWGCRGFLPEATVKDKNGNVIDNKMENLKKKFDELAKDKDMENLKEVFGVK